LKCYDLSRGLSSESEGFAAASLTGLLPASPVRKGGIKGSYTKMAIFLTGKPRPGGRGGFTLGTLVQQEGRLVA
jgi:hypothetical protein